MSRWTRRRWLLSVVVAGTALSGCASTSEDVIVPAPVPTVVVSHAILGAVVAEIAGPAAHVRVLIPNGVDPHAYEPSARDIEALNSADLVVVNGLGLEARLQEALNRARAKKIPIFEAVDHVRDHDPDSSPVHDAQDPHFWTDPRAMADVVADLGDALTDLGIDISDRAVMLSERLLTLDHEIEDEVSAIPSERRVLVTGHESLGYFAQRYGFRVVGTIIPGLTSGAEVSAGSLAAIEQAVRASGVNVIFTELGTPSATARVLSEEVGVRVVEISTHLIPSEILESGHDVYRDFIGRLAETIISALQT